MTQTIPLIQGQNYISFPAISQYNFRTIFIDSNIIDDIGTDASGNKMFYKYDSILNNYVAINLDIEYIEQGKGYYLFITSSSPGNIVYDGVEYTVTFDQFKSRIVNGWNLLGVGKDIIIPVNWCKIYDPKAMANVSILEPKHSYLVNYEGCIEPSKPGIETIVGFSVSVLLLIYMMKEFKIL